MQSNNRPYKPSCGDFHCEISSPVLRILQVNDRGVVLESREDYEIGSTIELGFHVNFPADSLEDHGRVNRTEFISGEGLVVGCQLCASAEGALVHEVTLLFTGISERDCQALRRFTRLQDGELMMMDSPEFVGLN